MTDALTRNGASEAIASTGGLLTAEQVAERWQVPKEQVYRHTREGRLGVVRVGRYYRYRVEAVEAFEVEGGSDE